MLRNEMKTREEIESMLRGYRAANVIGAGVELGVYEALAGGPRGAESVARKIKASARGTEILLNALVSVGLLRKRGGLFSLAEVAKKHLIDGAPEPIVSSVRHGINVQRSWIDLPSAVRTGRPVPRPPGKDGGPDTRRHRDFILAMHDVSRGPARALAAALDLSGVRRVLDVGGGPGSFLFAMIRRNPAIQGAVFDLPETLAITREMIAAENMRHAVGTIEGDFLTDDFGDGFDLILMSSIVHINSFSENKLLARKAFRALNPGGRLVVRDHILDDTLTAPLDGALFSINMLVNTEKGRSYSKPEIKSWFADAGFGKIQYMEIPPRSAIMIGTKPKNTAKKKG
jgi:SAM-dependent methyltransferase